MSCPGAAAVYSEADIQILDGLERIRRHPGMYIGNTGAGGLHVLLFNLIAESLADAARGAGRAARVTLRPDNSAEVADEGIPFYDGEPPPGATPVEFIFTRVFVGYQPDPNGRDWLTYATANALATELTVCARSPGSRYQHTFRGGVTHAVLQTGGPPDDCGLTVRFRPDPDIFGDARFDPAAIRDRLRQCAFLHSGVCVSFTDEAAGTRDEFEYADGIGEYVRWLNRGRTPLHADVIAVRGEENGVRYEVGLQWRADGEPGLEMGFANGQFNPQGGTHITGFRAAVTRTLNDFAREHLPGSRALTGDNARRGLTAVVAVRIAEPQYEGATRGRLSSPDVERVIATSVRRLLRDYFDANREIGECVVRTRE